RFSKLTTTGPAASLEPAAPRFHGASGESAGSRSSSFAFAGATQAPIPGRPGRRSRPLSGPGPGEVGAAGAAGGGGPGSAVRGASSDGGSDAAPRQPRAKHGTTPRTT